MYTLVKPHRMFRIKFRVCRVKYVAITFLFMFKFWFFFSSVQIHNKFSANNKLSKRRFEKKDMRT